MTDRAVVDGTRTAGTRFSRLRPGWSLVSVGALMVAWELFGRFETNQLVPPLSKVLVALGDLIQDGSLLDAILTSIQALLIGFTLAMVVGIGTGIAMASSEDLEEILRPYINVLLAVPSVAYIVLLLLWLGTGLVARVAIVFEYSVLLIAINTLVGVKGVDRSIQEMGLSFNLTRSQQIRLVILPAALPAVVAGVRLGLGRGVKGMVNSEMLLTLVGIGGMIKYYGSAFRTDYLLALVVVVVGLAIILIGAVDLIERRLTRWQPAH